MWLIIVLSFVGGFIVGVGITYVVAKPRKVGTLVLHTSSDNDNLFSLELHQYVNIVSNQKQVLLDVEWRD